MSESFDPAAHDKTNNLPEGPVSKYVDRMLLEVTQSGLSEQQQAKTIGNHLIGSLLRVQGAEKGLATIHTISEVAGRSNITDDDGNAVSWTRAISRSEGIRRAIVDIDQEPVGKWALGTLDTGVRVDHEQGGKILISSMDQMSAYFGTETPSEAFVPGHEQGVPWKDTIMSEVADYLRADDMTPPWKRDANLGSDIEGVRTNQQEWQRAVGIAQVAGIDMNLITSSAEFMKSEQHQGREVGHIALLNVAPDYSSLIGQ